MINCEVKYERDINASYMKVPAIAETNLDETIWLKNPIKGLIPVEKVYCNQKGQYWYRISGKQSLEGFCKISKIDRAFFETLILCICELVETLEWNLLDSNCLVLEKEYVFLSSNANDISFVFYPTVNGGFLDGFRGLIEYLLSQIDHRDAQVTDMAYWIYEEIQKDGFHIKDLKRKIIEGRRENEVSPIDNIVMGYNIVLDDTYTEASMTETICGKLSGLFEKAKEILKSMTKEEPPVVVRPEEIYEDEISYTVHPTVCISEISYEPKGILSYIGEEGYVDFSLEKKVNVIGKNKQVECQIARDTISQYHAVIEHTEEGYYLEDMNSTNGTFLNEELLGVKERKSLQIDDIIRFADVKYRFL